MRKIPALSLLLAVMIALLLNFTVKAQEGDFSESFERETLDGWEYSPGAVLRNGMLRIDPGNFAVKMGSYRLGVIEVRVRQPGGAVYIRYAMQEEASYAFIMLEDRLILEKTQGDVPQELGTTPRSAALGDWMAVRINLEDGHHQVYLDDQLVLEATDPDPINGGGLGFMVEGEVAAEFDDLQVTTVPVHPGEEQGAGPAQVEAVQATPTTQPDTGARLSISDLIDELTSIQAAPAEMSTFVINLALSVLFGYILSRVYVHWGSSLSNRRRFAANFILITVTTTFIILVVRSSVALSLGLVGALSIVRFRAAIKEPEELAYLFFAISIGIGLGDNQRMITAVALAAAILILGLRYLFRDRRADFNLHVSIVSPAPGKVDLESILDALQRHCSQVRLVRFDDSSRALESSFMVEFQNMQKLSDARMALRGLSDSLEITFMDNKGIG